MNMFKDSMIKLNNILTNRVKPKIKEEAQEFMTKLNEVMVVANIWLECQYKVIFSQSQHSLFLNNNSTNLNLSSGCFWKKCLPIYFKQASGPPRNI